MGKDILGGSRVSRVLFYECCIRDIYRRLSGDFKWAGVYMNLKFRIFLGFSMGIINIKMVFRVIGTDETT